MFSHVMHIASIDIYVYTGNCTCYVLFTFTLLPKIFTLFTLHITVLKRWQKMYYLFKFTIAVMQQNIRAAALMIKHDWPRHGRISEWWDISVKKWSCQKNCMQTYYVCSIYILSVSFYGFYEVLHKCSKFQCGWETFGKRLKTYL